MGDNELGHEQSTLAQPVIAPAAISYPFVLTVVEGPDVGTRMVVDIERPSRVLIGKGASCDLQLGDRSVSRRHLSAEVVRDRLQVRDLESTNGTVVDGMVVRDVLLVGGELIRIGSTAIAVERGQPKDAEALSRATAFGRTIGASERMRRLYPLCERLAKSDVPLIIEGETGVGKEQLAESLHDEGPRASGPFVVFDCTAVAPGLIESELFGHEKGAFTGSAATHQGVFERANGGTLLIDEIGDLPTTLQPKLLRAIERLQVTRVGGKEVLRLDVRVIAATRRDLDREVQAARFRDDLYHRLAVARIELPPLRERAGDVELLARHFWAQLAGTDAVPRDLLRRWEDYPWPGNVRELRNAVARRIALGETSDQLTNEASMRRVSAVHTVGPTGDPIAAVLALDLSLAEARQRILDDLEFRYVERVLELHQGNMERAAAAAGMGRRQLQRIKNRKPSE